jgi:hypothetical protein
MDSIGPFQAQDGRGQTLANKAFRVPYALPCVTFYHVSSRFYHGSSVRETKEHKVSQEDGARPENTQAADESQAGRSGKKGVPKVERLPSRQHGKGEEPQRTICVPPPLHVSHLLGESCAELLAASDRVFIASRTIAPTSTACPAGSCARAELLLIPRAYYLCIVSLPCLNRDFFSGKSHSDRSFDRVIEGPHCLDIDHERRDEHAQHHRDHRSNEKPSKVHGIVFIASHPFCARNHHKCWGDGTDNQPV